MIVYTARWVLPVTSRPVRDGAVAVENEKITAVGALADVLAAAGEGAELRDLGEALVMPGLVNAHTHVELSWMAADPPPGGEFVAWVRGFLERRAAEDLGVARGAATRAIEALERRGTAAVGDVGNGSWIAPLLMRSKLGGVLFHEVYDFRASEAERVAREAGRRVEKLSATAPRDWQVVAVPHAPYTCSPALMRSLAGRAAQAGQPFSIHLAESEAEIALLRDGSGPFRELLGERGLWDDAWHAPNCTPVEHLERLGGLGKRTLAVHCVHLTQQDHSRLQTRGTTVVACPRSNARLGVGRAPLPRLLAEGIPVALGTDSLASNEDLDLFAEIAAARSEHPALAPLTLLRMATLHGAAALGLGDRLGSIEPGKRDRLLVIPLDHAEDDPLERVCSVPPQVYWLAEAPSSAGAVPA